MAYAELLFEAKLINGNGRAFAGEGGTHSWAEVRDLTARIAEGLATEFSLERGVRVALLMGISQDQALLSFALSWLGVTIVPVNTRLSTADISAVLRHADVELLFWDAANEACALDVIQGGVVANGAAADTELLNHMARGVGRARADWGDDDIAARAPIPLSWSYAVLPRFHAAATVTMVSSPSLMAELRSRGFEHLDMGVLWH